MSNTSVTENPPVVPQAPPAQTTGPLAGAPGTVGLPMAIVGAFGLGLVNTGFVPASAAAAAVPTLIGATALGLLLTTVWACALGENSTASIFALFFGFFGSYSALSLGFINDWYGIPAEETANAEAAWLICWVFIFLLLTFVTLRLPLSFTLLFGLVDIALILLLIGNLQSSASMTNLGGWFTFAFIAVVVYLYADVMSSQTGGRGLPLGKPLVR